VSADRDAQRAAHVAALRRERAAMELHGKADRVDAIDAALAELGERDVPAPEQAAPKRRRTASADVTGAGGIVLPAPGSTSEPNEREV
jgi:hypothetical protein